MAIGEKESLTFDYKENKQRIINPPIAGINVPVDFDKLVEKIYLSPNAPGWFESLINRWSD